MTMPVEELAARAFIATPVLRGGIRHMAEALINELERTEWLSDLIDVEIRLRPKSADHLIASLNQDGTA